MKQVVTVAPGQMQVTDVEQPLPQAGEALIAVRTVGLCGSDYHLYDGTHPYARFPQVQGHEVVGVVVALGSGAAGPPVGTQVAVEPLVACGHCFACKRARYNCCRDLKVLGAHLPGGLSEFMAVPAQRLHPTGDLPAEIGVLSEPFSIGLHAIGRGGVCANDDVVVLGAGPIGLAVTLAAVDRGARVLVVDRLDNRLDAATSLGAWGVVHTGRSDLAAEVDRFTDGQGGAVVVDATGAPELIRAALDLVAHSGTIVVAGISQRDVSLPVADLSRKEVTIAGSRNNAGVFAAAIDLVRRHQDKVAPLVTHQFALDQTADAIDLAIARPDLVEKAIIAVSENT